MEADQMFAFICQIQYTDSSEVVDLQGFANRISKVDTCGCVQDYVKLVRECLTDLRVNTETRKD